MVVPQSPQKFEVMIFPASVTLLYCLGVPDSIFKASLLTKRLMLYTLPLTLRQSSQWHSVYATHQHDIRTGSIEILPSIAPFHPKISCISHILHGWFHWLRKSFRLRVTYSNLLEPFLGRLSNIMDCEDVNADTVNRVPVYSRGYRYVTLDVLRLCARPWAFLKHRG